MKNALISGLQHQLSILPHYEQRVSASLPPVSFLPAADSSSPASSPMSRRLTDVAFQDGGMTLGSSALEFGVRLSILNHANSFFYLPLCTLHQVSIPFLVTNSHESSSREEIKQQKASKKLRTSLSANTVDRPSAHQPPASLSTTPCRTGDPIVSPPVIII